MLLDFVLFSFSLTGCSESVMKPLFRFAYITYEGEVNWHIVNEPSLSVAVTHHVSKEAHRKVSEMALEPRTEY